MLPTVRPIGHQYLFALWSGCRSGGLVYPLWSRFDILFKHFNSGVLQRPGDIRLLRAGCGQHHRIPTSVSR